VPTLPIEWRKRFRDCIKRNAFDVLVVVYGGTGVALLPEIENLKIPIAVSFCGSDAQMSDNNKWYADQLKRLWNRADKCIFVCEFLKEQACRRGCPVEKSSVIYSGKRICRKPAGVADKCNVRFICAASMLPVKGYKYLIEAFSYVRKKTGNSELLLIGDGPLRADLELLAEELDVKDSVRFLGTLAWEQVQDEMQGSDIYVQASVKASDGGEEGLPMAVLEAQACGLPAIVFRSGGLCEIIDNGENGFLIPERDTKAFGEAMIALAQDADLRRRMSEVAQQKILDRFDQEKSDRTWREMLYELSQTTKMRRAE
jgi:glycosyltransferase involved in cell wall biosynthesis